MKPMTSVLDRALPKEIPFYHLGEIRHVDSNPSAPPEGRCALAYALLGDLRAALLLTLDQGLDLSMYAEAGNLLASRLATRLAEQAGMDVMISPPAHLDGDRLASLWSRLSGAGSEILLERDYLHVHGDSAVPIRVYLLSPDLIRQLNVENQGVGHA